MVLVELDEAGSNRILHCTVAVIRLKDGILEGDRTGEYLALHRHGTTMKTARSWPATIYTDVSVSFRKEITHYRPIRPS